MMRWLLALACTGVLLAEEPKHLALNMIGNLAPEFYQEAPLGVAEGGRVTLRFVNVTGGPCGLAAIGGPPMTFPAALWLLENAKEPGNDPIGPAISEALRDQLDCIIESRIWSRWKPARGRERLDPVWKSLRAVRLSRDTLALMPNEGYATQLLFLPGWLTEPDRPKVARVRKIGLQAGPFFDLVVAAKTADAVLPGKPIVWGERTPNCIPAKLRAIDIVPGAAPATTTADPLAAPGPAVLHLEVDGVLTKDGDLALTYLIGNVASAPLWVQQNTCSPAAVTWSLHAKDHEVAAGNGQSYAALAQLMPMRPAFPLLPGEFLTWKLSLPASALTAVRKGTVYTLRLRLDATLISGASIDGAVLPPPEAMCVVRAD